MVILDIIDNLNGKSKKLSVIATRQRSMYLLLAAVMIKLGMYVP